MATLEELKVAILEDGTIDAEEVKQLKEVLYEDKKIDREEADFLFELNDAVSGKDNDPSWQEFMVEAITDHVLLDPESPMVLDDEECDWLIGKIEGDGQYDEVEIAIIRQVMASAISVPSKLSDLAAKL